MLLWPLFIMIRLRFTDHSPGKYYYLHHDSAKTRAQNCHLGFPSCHPLTHRTDIELVFFVVVVLLSFLLSQSPTSDQVERSGRITWIQNVTSKKENVGPKRDRMLVNVCMHFHIDNLGQWEGTVRASDTLTLLHADH